MKVVGIVAVGKNLEIGKDGALPWHHPEDLSFFKRTTSGHVVVMGYNTWLSIGRPLPNRTNVVISKSRRVDIEGVVTLRKPEDVFERFGDADVVYLIGGSQTYRSFGAFISDWLVTRIPETVPGADAFMDSDFLDGFVKTSEERLSPVLVVEHFERKK